MSEVETPIQALLKELEASSFSSCVIDGGGRRMILRLPVETSLPAATELPAAVAEASPNGLGAAERSRVELCSPRVGHFYPRTGIQGGLRYKKGELLARGEVYGTIEAMHLKYELRADHSGVVDEFLAAEGEAVEYGQPLVALRPVASNGGSGMEGSPGEGILDGNGARSNGA